MRPRLSSPLVNSRTPTHVRVVALLGHEHVQQEKRREHRNQHNEAIKKHGNTSLNHPGNKTRLTVPSLLSEKVILLLSSCCTPIAIIRGLSVYFAAKDTRVSC